MPPIGLQIPEKSSPPATAESQLSPRLHRLKEAVVSSQPQVYAERALLVTEAYREREDASPAAKRALTMDKIFRQGSILIKDDELIVGCKTPTPLGSPLYPEFNCKWIGDELDTLTERFETAFHISDESKKRIKKEVIPFWRGKTVYDDIVARVPPESLQAVDEGLFFHYFLNRSIGHINVDYQKVLELGFRGIRQQIGSAIAEISADEDSRRVKEHYYNALLEVVDAVVVFANRYADLAEKMAGACHDPERKDELLYISRVCRRVPEHPAETFWEALQSFWFTHLMLNLESNAYALSPGRFDQYIDPFYKRDVADNGFTQDDAQELLNCLWVKFAEMTVVKEAGTAKASNTYADFQNLNVGGLKADGSDGVNDISYMCIAAQSALMLPQPQLSCLISSKSPQEFLLKACELARQGTGMPAMFNADEIVLSLTEKGKSLEDARNGGINGCVEITGQGNDQMASSGYINLAKCLELALNDGINMLTGVADSLAAIDRFVFQEKYLTLSQLVQALKDNFEGHEVLHGLLSRQAPKFGNDLDSVDQYAVRLIGAFNQILKGFTNPQGNAYVANMIPTTTHLPFGDKTAASADGRLARAPLAEGISPVQGKDMAGPTAVVKTMAKIDHAATAGTLLNMKFSPDTLAGDLGLRKFAALIRTYFDLGGHHMQFNVVSRQTLQAAQSDPDNHRSLLIRVAGYSDYFVMLSKDVQDEVISRTEHGI
jgi:pyruvate-formate lyase